MKVLKTENIGFCFGVKRAVKMVLKHAEKTNETVHTIGPIIHNPQMVNILKEKKVIPVDNVFEVKNGVVVFRTHGIKKEEEEYIRKTGLKVIDATCPFVKRVRKHAMYLKSKGYQVVIVGDKSHPEVKSVLSYLDGDGIVLQEPKRLDHKKVGVVSQTTLDKDTFVNIVKELIGGVEELRVYNTICESTSVRQKEAVVLSGKVDMMLVVGGKNSSNTTKLYKVVNRVQPNTHHIETEEDIKPEWFKNVHAVGITGGASTPDLIIDIVERRVKNL
ncbi:MAG TPA: 4-hydroxy-3-methylbut-2-enyl diphosphate reductase [Syntrophorhabdaceae bacterium]|nr:4-hydroxy-3-methylbut-2-enyl diphosphate reductase [Syntrophorhabdaceae bacterium]